MPDRDISLPCEVFLTDEAYYAYAAIPSDALFEHIGDDMGLLESTPYIGREYGPAYEAMKPPFECRVLFCEHYGIYYSVDDEACAVTIFAVEDQRRNPQDRFAAQGFGEV